MLFRDEVVRKRADSMHGSVVLSQPRATTMIVVALGVLMIGFLAFAFLGEYSRTETARGILITDPPSAKISVARQGVVSEIFVRDGDIVRKGDPLVRIDTDIQTGEGARIAAGGVAAIELETDLQRKQSIDIRNSYRSAGYQLDAQVADLDSQVRTYENQVAMQRGVVDSNRELLAKAERVAERGFVSGVEIERRRQQVIQSEQQLANLEQQLVTTRSSLQRALLQKSSLQADMSRELNLLETSVSRLERERDQMAGSKEFVIASPISGKVTAMQLAQGQTATPGISAMTIVPLGKQVEAQVFAPSRAIGLVDKGQEVNLLVDAFPYQRYGNIDGKVEMVSATMIDPRQIDAPFKVEEPVFRIRVLLNEEGAELAGRGIVLQPGMTLQASIVLERRTFLEWLLSPLTAVTKRNQ